MKEPWQQPPDENVIGASSDLPLPGILSRCIFIGKLQIEICIEATATFSGSDAFILIDKAGKMRDPLRWERLPDSPLVENLKSAVRASIVEVISACAERQAAEVGAASWALQLNANLTHVRSFCLRLTQCLRHG
jgi:hypothetical protein